VNDVTLGRLPHSLTLRVPFTHTLRVAMRYCATRCYAWLRVFPGKCA